MRTPLIAIIGDRKRATSGPWVDVLTDGNPHTYIEAVSDGGGAPIIFPAIPVHLAETERLLDLVDGVFLPGGRDIDAAFYGQPAHAENDPPLSLRDELEIEFVRGARRRGMPVLGACRGMQVMNVALGGTLEQHLGDRVEPTPHRDTVGVFTTHEVRIADGSRLAAIVGTGSFEIASHHHQAVERIADGFVATAWAADGVIEALETEGDEFCLGVQWHPEQQLDVEGRALARAFVEAAGAYGESRNRI